MASAAAHSEREERAGRRKKRRGKERKRKGEEREYGSWDG
jgi:hypothetical protein